MHKLNQDHRYQPARRQFLIGSAAASALTLTPALRAADMDGAGGLPKAFGGLKPLGGRVRPVTADEFHERLARGHKMMSELVPKDDALFFAPETSLFDFTGILSRISKRL